MVGDKVEEVKWKGLGVIDDWLQDQGEDQRRPGKRLYVRTVKHVS